MKSDNNIKIKKLDSQGRICIPKELLNKIKFDKNKDYFLIDENNSEIILSKVNLSITKDEK